ncbi:MAG TPA: serine acetyltransferase [Lachnospiraceae bacterium]|nr:serine acetyltransferase [Lachnospiraceae bacterium]
MGRLICDNISEIISDITNDYRKHRPIDNQDIFGQPDRDAVKDIIYKLNRIVYAGYYVDRTYRIYNISTTIASVTEDVAYNLNKQIALSLHFDERFQGKSEEEIRLVAEDYTVQFMKQIPRIREYLDTDIEALYVGDPAAESKDAIIIAYPGLFAITVQRYAHVLYLLEVPILPRVMTEIAHSKTGIDINPGATIGKYFFIDHGTGVVIGETTVIGKHVKIYQGVTLGALSTRGGRGLIDKKRHPTIEDNVTIYSGASILGGDTVIGEGSVIGGNVFLTKSVPAGTKVHVANQELSFDGKNVKDLEPAEDEKSWFYVI